MPTDSTGGGWDGEDLGLRSYLASFHEEAEEPTNDAVERCLNCGLPLNPSWNMIFVARPKEGAGLDGAARCTSCGFDFAGD